MTNKQIIVISIITGLLISCIIQTGHCFEFDSVGYGISVGGEANFLQGWQSKEYDYGYVKVFGVFEKELLKNWFVDIEPGIGIHRAWNDTESVDGMSIGADSWFGYNVLRIGKNSSIYTALGVGLLTMLPADGQPELSASGVLGMFGGRIGYRHKMEKRRLLVDVSMGLEHFSDPFNGDDAGRNFGTLAVSLSFLQKKGR